MASTFHCVVATPTRKLFDDSVYYASVPGCEGSYGVLAGHELLVALNSKSGICTLNLDEAGSQKEEFLISEGATQMYNGILTVLGRFGKNVKDIDRESMAARADEMREHIKELEAVHESAQDKAELESSRDRLEWYERQIRYVDEGK
ncbi:MULTISPECIES: F0F1 ATP synthase subunit epsilon [unclassified Adlercreutzia]|uniref:FoF1 ATP synthase subunit delta/epsilon n=1 Tax=unclassified Adlercreutzia TaxID=2636013 RepID=UPI0013EC1EC1|nr:MULTISPECIES: F0F1 ATP synthase subunit epsilon [unclassified Adlercreutzia]